jgi:hypothetical protein
VRAYRFGIEGKWAVGWLRNWADSVPRGPFYIFLLFSSFLFLVSLFKHNFCKSASIQTKLLPEIFKKTAHYSKSVVKQVFK